jgi:hypothetical protein
MAASPVPNLSFFFFFPQTKTGLNCQCSCGNSSSSSPLVCLCVCVFLSYPLFGRAGPFCVSTSFHFFLPWKNLDREGGAMKSLGCSYTHWKTLWAFSLSLSPTSPFVVVFSFSFLKFSPPQSSLHILLYGGEIVYTTRYKNARSF